MSEVSFLATLAGTNTSAKWLTVGSDGDAKVQLETSGVELHQLLLLAGTHGKLLKVTVEWDTPETS